MKKYIYDKLMEYQKHGELPLHMPGHKRKINNDIQSPYAIDLTEIDGFDDLHDPQEIILDSMKEVRRIYGTKQSYYLVNGSTSGLLTAISACCRCNDKIIIARNCHKAVYHAIRLLQLDPFYIPIHYHSEYEISGGVKEEALYQMLHSEMGIKAVVITSPTYEGVVSDIQTISQWTRELGIPLIVDEAHGAHLRYQDSFPVSAVELGADLVIQSLHKTLPSLTQTAILHVCSDLAEEERIQSYLSIYQSSSPSYVFLAGMEYAIAYAEEQKEKWDEYAKLLVQYRDRMQKFQYLKLIGYQEMQKYGAFAYDPCKFVISVKGAGMTGMELKEQLLKHDQIQLEMAERHYVIAMTSIMDEKEDLEQFYQALKRIDQSIRPMPEREIAIRKYSKKQEGKENDQIQKLKKQEDNQISKLVIQENDQIQDSVNQEDKHKEKPDSNSFYEPNYEQVFIPGKAADLPGAMVLLADSQGQVSRDSVYIYPPGIPILVPGERIQEHTIQVIRNYLESGFGVKGITDGKIRICVQKTIYQQKDMI